MNAGTSGHGTATARGKIKFGRLIAYSTLQLPLAMAALPVVLNVSHFYGEVLKLRWPSWGPFFIIARIVDAIQDPVIGLIATASRDGPRGRLTLSDDASRWPAVYMLFDPPDRLVRQPDADGGLADRGAVAGPLRLFGRVDQLPATAPN